MSRADRRRSARARPGKSNHVPPPASPVEAYSFHLGVALRTAELLATEFDRAMDAAILAGAEAGVVLEQFGPLRDQAQQIHDALHNGITQALGAQTNGTAGR